MWLYCLFQGYIGHVALSNMRVPRQVHSLGGRTVLQARAYYSSLGSLAYPYNLQVEDVETCVEKNQGWAVSTDCVLAKGYL